MALSDFIMVDEGIVVDDFCTDLIDVYHKNPHEKSGVGNHILDSGYRIADEFNLSESGHHAMFHRALTHLAMLAYDLYKREIGNDYSQYLPDANEMSVEAFRIKHYKKGVGFYNEHVDNVGNRMLAVIFYLNTVEYGGETQFPMLNYGVKPVAGRCLVFPTTWQYPHQATIPIDCDKYIIQGYLNDERNNDLTRS